MRAYRKGKRFARQCGAMAVLAAVLLFSAHAVAQATVKIVAIGTSNTYGRGVARGSDYPSKLEAALKAKGHDVRVINAGKNGDTIAGGLARLDTAVPADTQIAIVEFGVNDRRSGVGINKIQSTLAEIVDRLRARKVEVLVANYLDVAGGAAAHGALFVSVDVARIPMSLRIAEDPYHHLNAAGNDVIVARMLPSVEALIARLPEGRR